MVECAYRKSHSIDPCPAPGGTAWKQQVPRPAQTAPVPQQVPRPAQTAPVPQQVPRPAQTAPVPPPAPPAQTSRPAETQTAPLFEEAPELKKEVVKKTTPAKAKAPAFLLPPTKNLPPKAKAASVALALGGRFFAAASVAAAKNLPPTRATSVAAPKRAKAVAKNLLPKAKTVAAAKHLPPPKHATAPEADAHSAGAAEADAPSNSDQVAKKKLKLDEDDIAALLADSSGAPATQGRTQTRAARPAPVQRLSSSGGMEALSSTSGPGVFVDLLPTSEQAHRRVVDPRRRRSRSPRRRVSGVLGGGSPQGFGGLVGRTKAPEAAAVGPVIGRRVLVGPAGFGLEDASPNPAGPTMDEDSMDDAMDEDSIMGEDSMGEDSMGEDSMDWDSMDEVLDARSEDARGEDARSEDARSEDAMGEDARSEEVVMPSDEAALMNEDRTGARIAREGGVGRPMRCRPMRCREERDPFVVRVEKVST